MNPDDSNPDDSNRLPDDPSHLLSLVDVEWLRSIRLFDRMPPAKVAGSLPVPFLPHVVTGVEFNGGATGVPLPPVARDEVAILCGPTQATTVSLVVPLESIAFGADWAITVGDFRILAPRGLSDPESEYHWYAMDDHWARIVVLVEEVTITRLASTQDEGEPR